MSSLAPLGFAQLTSVRLQGAYGILCEVDSHPFPTDAMLFMDWRDSHTFADPDMQESNRYAIQAASNKPADPNHQALLSEHEPVCADQLSHHEMRLMTDHGRDLTNLTQQPYCRKLPTFLYAMPFSDTRLFLEETSLVARPGVPFEELKQRLDARLAHYGIKIK